MARRSAGILLYRRLHGAVQVLLVHPGGPVWRRRDRGAWSIPKGEYDADEDGRACAVREFEEELGTCPPVGVLWELGSVRQAGGKHVTAWALEGEFDVATVRSNTFTMVWPPGCAREQTFPEVDRAVWFTLARARDRLHPAQAAFLDRLAARLSDEKPG